MPNLLTLTFKAKIDKRFRRVATAKTAGLAACFVLLLLGQVTVAKVSAAQPTKMHLGLGDWDYLHEAQAAKLQSDGLENFRAALRWDYIQPDAQTFRWQYVDQLMRTAWSHDINVTLVVDGCPQWVCVSQQAFPTSDWQQQRFQEFLSAAVYRYSNDGFLQSPGIVARATTWQIYNEINAGAQTRPSPNQYAKIVAMSSSVIKQIDPKAQTVAAGLTRRPATSLGTSGTKYLKSLYRSQSFRKADVVAVHGYTATPNQTLRWIKQVKQIQRRYHDRRPLWVTEFGYGSDYSTHPFSVGPAKQAQYFRQTVQLLQSQVQALYWFGLNDLQPGELPDAQPWSVHTGMFDANGAAKPLYHQFQQALRLQKR